MNVCPSVGHGCNTAVEYSLFDLKVVSSNPAGCLAFLLLSISSFYLITSEVSLIRFLTEVHLIRCIVKRNIAVLPEAKQAQ